MININYAELENKRELSQQIVRIKKKKKENSWNDDSSLLLNQKNKVDNK
jgi:hypothetical protein